jgi:hypothetical protein
MEEKKLSIQFPRRSLVYLMICGAGILVFVLGGIFPSYRDMVRMDGSIADLKAQIEEQKVLFPLYRKLLGELTAEKSKSRTNPPKSGLPVRRMDDLSPIFGEIAANCGLEVSAIAPDVKSLVDESHFLSVVLALKGSFFNLHRFLLEVANLPYLWGIEDMHIQEGSAGKEYHLKAWLIIDNPRPASG